MSQHRRVLAVLAFAAVCPLSFLGQSKPNFNVQSQQLTNDAGPTYSLKVTDLNNDGVPDLVQVEANRFICFLGKGDGTFKQGFTYTFAINYQSGLAVAAGDFNGDGLDDLVIVLNGTKQIAVFLGKGDGTFQAPKYETFALPSGYTLGNNSGSAVSADFNRDGKLDLATPVGATGASSMDVLPGNGDGTFGTPIPVYAAAAGHSVGPSQVLTGDFDGDARADIAFEDFSNCNFSGQCTTALHVLFGDAGFTFTDAMVYSSPYGPFTFGVGDVDSNSRSDLFAVVGPLGSQQLAVMYGQTDRTFALYTQATGRSTTVEVEQYNGFELGDFNGDGRMDIVGLSYNTSDVEYFTIFLGTSTQGSFTQQLVTLPKDQQWSGPVVGDFNRDLKPDIVTTVVDNSGSTGYIVEARNTTSSGFWGGCMYPRSGMGVGMCNNGTAGLASPVHFNATANSYGNLRKIELWVDGKKVAEQWHAWEQRAWFNKSITIAPGNHNASFIAGDVDNHLQRLKFSFSVVNCSVPSSPGVHVCSPTNGSIVTSPVNALAVAKVTGTLQRMELWVDGVKKATFENNNVLSLYVSEPAGKHKFTFFAVNTAGTKWASTVYATVK